MFFWRNVIMVCIIALSYFWRIVFSICSYLLCFPESGNITYQNSWLLRDLLRCLLNLLLNYLNLLYFFNKFHLTVVLVVQKKYKPRFFRILYRLYMGRLAIFHTMFILCGTNCHHNREPKRKAKCCIRTTFPPEKIPTLGEHTFLWMHTHNFHYC